MKKMALLLAFLLVVSFPVSAQAATPEEVSPLALKVYPSISFDGTTAKCSVTVIADNMSDSISVTLKLWKGSSCVASWKSSGEGYVNFSVKEIVTLGLEYKLTADVIINGVPKPTVSVSGIC